MPAATAAWTQWLQNAVNTIRLLGSPRSDSAPTSSGPTATRCVRGRTVRRARRTNIRRGGDQQRQKGGSGGRVDALADLVATTSRSPASTWTARGSSRSISDSRHCRWPASRRPTSRARSSTARLAALHPWQPAASFTSASLRGADLTGARLSAVNLAGADLFDVRGWREIAAIAPPTSKARGAARVRRVGATQRHGRRLETARWPARTVARFRIL